MKSLNIVISAVLLTSLSVGVASAQESDKYHPLVSSTFSIGLGAYRPTKKNSIGADLDLNDENLQRSLDTTESQSTGILGLRWRYTENWSFAANLWTTSSDSRDTLTEDYQNPFGDEVFVKGSFIESGIDTSIARLFWGRSFSGSPNTDWGVGLGLHWMEFDAYVEGEISVTGAGGSVTEFRRDSATAGAPLPNLGVWYMYSWSPKWVVITRLDWLDITFDEFSGSMLDVSVGVNYQMSEHFGMGLAVNAFELNVSVDTGTENFDLETSQYGPRLNLTWNW